ncbi:MAG: PilZ domain-containing protein [Bdellovibrionales bacterium]
MDIKPASRYPLELDIEFKKSYARDLSTGTLKNVSLTGAFIENSLGDLSFKDKITINLNLSGRERVLSATVIWRDGRGCGIRFSPFNNQDIQIVDDLIYFLESKRETRKDVLSNIFKKVS